MFHATKQLLSCCRRSFYDPSDRLHCTLQALLCDLFYSHLLHASTSCGVWEKGYRRSFSSFSHPVQRVCSAQIENCSSSQDLQMRKDQRKTNPSSSLVTTGRQDVCLLEFDLLHRTSSDFHITADHVDYLKTLFRCDTLDLAINTLSG